MKYNIKSKNMYNMDESGFSIGEKEAERCIINAQIHQKFQAKPECQEWIIMMKCICVDENIIPPLVIFRAENLTIYGRLWSLQIRGV